MGCSRHAGGYILTVEGHTQGAHDLASHDLAPVILTSPRLISKSSFLIADRIHARGYQLQASTTTSVVLYKVVSTYGEHADPLASPCKS
jgi:hypothetical protein